ncbi:MAG: hypothetical protein L0Y75_00355 [Acidobacteria bacterium]|nr:hypothetical protein [Acidobacteriota bacterium]
MIRTFDHAGYYETRLILLAINLAIACYFIYYKRDQRFLVMFASGAILQTIIEYALQFGGLRNNFHSISVFGSEMSPYIGPVIQGFTEGSAIAMFAFWFADLRSSKAGIKRWLPLILVGLVIVVLAFVAGSAAQNRPISSARPMFASRSIFAVTGVIFVSLYISWRKDTLSSLANYYAGILVFAFLNYEPLHVMGARYIGVFSDSQYAPAAMPAQAVVMLLSHLFEAAGGKLHYFIIPLALGLVSLREREDGARRERYSTQHLQDLAQRGWRKKSKPFTK